MRWLLLGLVACGSADDADKGDTAPLTTTGPTADDPRFDRSTWPTEIGGDRPATVRAPASWDGTSRLPVLVVLHGYSANGLAQDLYFQASARSEPDQVIVVVPEGTVDADGYQFWNASVPCCDFYGTDVDDVGYLTGLLDEVEASFPVDADRLYLIGHSNGGFMAYRLGCELGDRLAGIVSLAGTAEDRSCADTLPSVLHLHGTADDTIGYETNPWTMGAVDSVSLWGDRAGCTSTESAGRADFLLDVDGVDTEKTRWTGCDAGFAAELWTFEGGSHIPALNDDLRDEMYAWLFAQ